MCGKIFVSAFFLAAICIAGDKPALSPREINKQAVQSAHDKNLEKHKNNADILVLPGLIANRKKKKITVKAEASGLEKNGTVEFFLIAENSGHDYEALAVSFARPSDIHKALVFIGMLPGEPVSLENLRFLPRGERVMITVSCADTNVLYAAVSAEKLVVNTRTGKPLPDAGFVFTGSSQSISINDPGKQVYRADEFGPNCIVSLYNEPDSVLDVPREASQNSVYDSQVINPDLRLPPDLPLEIIFEPEYKDGKKRVVDLELTVKGHAPAPGREEDTAEIIGALEFIVKDENGKILNSGKDLKSVLKIFTELIEKGHDPFVALRFDDDLELRSINDVCRILSSIATGNGIRLEPPLENHLCYRAFIPNESYRERKMRYVQPWELHLSLSRLKNSKVTGLLHKLNSEWNETTGQLEINVTDYEISEPLDLRKTLKNKDSDFLVLFIFADPSIPHGKLMDFLKPTLTPRVIVHIFLLSGSLRFTP